MQSLFNSPEPRTPEPAVSTDSLYIVMGKLTSEAKAEEARENRKLGGRPRIVADNPIRREQLKALTYIATLDDEPFQVTSLYENYFYASIMYPRKQRIRVRQFYYEKMDKFQKPSNEDLMIEADLHREEN